MDANAKQTALRMIPHAIYILTSEDKDGKIGAAGISWVTQASFEPPLIMLGVKADSLSHQIIKETGVFALNFLGKGQQDVAFAFFKATERKNNTIGGQPFSPGKTGSPLLENAIAFVECRLVDTVEKGDHSVFVGEVINAGVNQEPESRPDDASLWLKDLGDKVFYGG